MGIVDEDIARVRAATDFVALAGEHIALRRVGRSWSGLCPFHGEKSPSFSLNPELGVYYCFGCQASGDVITFVRELEHLDFVDAVERLAQKANITLRYDNETSNRDHQRRGRLHEALEAAISWYHQRLLAGQDSSPARAYLRHERGYDGEMVRKYRLGWAPDGWDHLVRGLGVPAPVLTDAGLAYVNDRGRHTDFFRARLLFPIFEAGGRPVGAGGRMLPGGRPPKYKNTTNTAVYDKGRVLYGLNWAKTDVVAKKQVVVCEGYTDVIGLHCAGVGEAVATCGTALADGHIRLLTNFARRIVLAYDADAAGQHAAEHYADWEQRFDIDIRVAALPPGSDPADLARRDPDALHHAIETARPYLGFRLERLLGAADLGTPESRVRSATAAMGLVASHPNEMVRDQYLMEVADRCRIEPGRLRALAADPPPSPGGGGPEPDRRVAARPAAPAVTGTELEALRLAVHRPDEIAERLEPVLLAHPLAVAVYDALAGADTLHAAIDAADPQAAALLQRLAVEEPEVGTDDIMVRLVERAGDRALRELQAEMRQAAEPAAYGPTIAWLKLALETVRGTAETSALSREAEISLVRWLVDRSQPEPVGDGHTDASDPASEPEPEPEPEPALSEPALSEPALSEPAHEPGALA